MVSTLSRPPQSYTTPAYVALTGIYEGGTLSFNVIPCMLSCYRKKEKLAQLVMLERMQTKKNAVAASRAESLALPALVMDIKTGSESISSNEKQYTSLPMQWTYKFVTGRSQVLLF